MGFDLSACGYYEGLIIMQWNINNLLSHKWQGYLSKLVLGLVESLELFVKLGLKSKRYTFE